MMPSRRRGIHAACRSFVAVMSVLALGCTSPTSDATRGTSRTTIVFANDSHVASARPAGPFVSVLDSIDLVVTSPGNATIVHRGQRLHGYDSTAAFSFDLPSGTNTFAAQVLSSRGTVIFSGTASHASAADRDTVVIPLTASQPALLVTLDTARTTVVTSSQYTIYNAGSGTLTWSVTGTDTAFTRCGTACLITPLSGSLAAGQSATMRVSVPSGFPSRLFSFVVHSTEGDVTPRWQYSASPINGVSVQPAASLLRPGQSVALTATVDGGGASSPVAWSSSNSVANVTSAGRVLAATFGAATITATSLVDTSKKGLADIRVYDTASVVSGWVISAPADLAAINRDGARLPTILLTARLFDASGTFINPFAIVEFWVVPTTGGAWIRIPQAPVLTVVDNAAGRTWSWSIAWDPSPVDAPFPNPSATNVAIVAIGIRPNGQVGRTPFNYNLTVRVP